VAFFPKVQLSILPALVSLPSIVHRIFALRERLLSVFNAWQKTAWVLISEVQHRMTSVCRMTSVARRRLKRSPQSPPGSEYCFCLIPESHEKIINLNLHAHDQSGPLKSGVRCRT